MRRPCQTITTSPGRSASQATPNDSAATTRRKRTARIIGGSSRIIAVLAFASSASAAAAMRRLAASAASRAFACCTHGSASVLADGGRLAMSLSAAAISACAASALSRASAEEGSRHGRADGRDADETFGVALKAAEEPTAARWRRSGRRLEFWHQLHELMRQNRVARNAGSGERCERRRPRPDPRRTLLPL